ncbi:MAG: autotransporter assembly complex family protein [Parvularculaceae bacterium]
MGSLSVLALAGRALGAENYVVVYDGAPGDLEDKLKKLTNLSLERRPYPTAAAIRRIGIEDLSTVKKALTAAGYYAGEAEFRLSGASEEKLKATFDINAGPLFKIATHTIVYEDAGDETRPATFEDAGVDTSDSADGASLARNQQAFLAALWSKGYPAARIIARRADARLEDGTAEAVYTFESGDKAVFDGVEVEGAEKTDVDFLEKLKTWQEGDIFDRAKLVTYRDRLGATGVFSTIEVAPGPVNDDGAAPVQVKVGERKQRTIGAGLSYSTSEGPGGRLFLEYRNLFRRGERARAEIDGSEISQSITFDVLKPLPSLPGSAFANLSFTNETTDAFTARSLEITGGFAKKWLDDRLETRGGVGLETSKVEPKLTSVATTTGDERTYYISVPLSATWDTEDDPLSLTKGVRASISATPYFGTDQFTRLEAVARSRIHFGANDRFTLAGRMRVAATTGQALLTLPVNKRVFSGGGSSVRGYDYQSVGPLDANGVPIGGRSGVEAALEARAKVFERVEIAAFADAGAVYAESFPDFAGDYLVGAGGGVRYLSAIGPIRLDFAVPLEKRPTDRDFQVYISLGQPF